MKTSCKGKRNGLINIKYPNFQRLNGILPGKTATGAHGVENHNDVSLTCASRDENGSSPATETWRFNFHVSITRGGARAGTTKAAGDEGEAEAVTAPESAALVAFTVARPLEDPSAILEVFEVCAAGAGLRRRMLSSGEG